MTDGLIGPPRTFDLDQFQVDAIDHLEAGKSVVVAAPTGSGKTFVGEYGIALAAARGKRGLFTTPIKALSNQKYRDLRGWLGTDNVGLLTGDNSINGDATAVVMTTEVLRNMLYSEPERLDSTDVVIMDEVHYLQNNFRGPVWEEVIIHLPSHIQLIALSATVSNADELAAWITSVHRECVPVTETTRPVQLTNSYFIAEKGGSKKHLIETLKKTRANPQGKKFDPAPRSDRRRGKSRGHGPAQKVPWRTPRRHEVIKELDSRGLLPAITFIFSRAGCEDAVSQLRSAGVTLTDPSTAVEITEYVESRTSHLSDDDRRALRYSAWLAGLRAGIAAHHAGMVPLFKEIVEELFSKGHLKAVFATETLALGINMPARTVVIEKLTKFTGEHHESLTPGDYTQLTGRAGRRGIDDEGSALVLWTPFTTFDEIVDLARSQSFELRSAFRPTYNMTCHLVSRYTRAVAEELLAKSFGQFQTDRAVTELELRRTRLRAELGITDESSRATPEPAAAQPTDDREHVDLGDLSEGERARRLADIQTAAAKLRPGDVIDIGQTVVVLSCAWRRKEVTLRVIDRDGDTTLVDLETLTEPPTTITHIRPPEPFNPNSRSHQHDLVGGLRKINRGSKKTKKAKRDKYGDRSDTEQAPLRNRDKHRQRQAERELRRVEAKITERRGRLKTRLRSIVGLLTDLGYIDQWTLTQRGEMLLGTFHELDLVLVEALRAGRLDDHNPATLAGIVSCFVYESRGRDDGPPPWYPSKECRIAVEGLLECVTEVQRLESAYGLPETREIDAGLVAATHGWAAGGGLGDILGTEELSGGDFVRSMKQVIDVLAQIASVAQNPKTRSTAHAAIELIRRGIVDAPLDVSADQGATVDEAAINEVEMSDAAGGEGQPGSGEDGDDREG